VRASFARFAAVAISLTTVLLVGVVAALVTDSGRLGSFGRFDLAGAASLAVLQVTMLAGPLRRRVALNGRSAERVTSDAVASSAFLSGVLASIDTGVAIVDRAGRVLEANDALRAIAGLDIGAPGASRSAADVVFEALDGGRSTGLADLAGAVTGAGDAASPLVLLAASGEKVPVLVRARPLRLPGGTAHGAVVTVVDVRDLAAQRRQLERRTEQLEAVTVATFAIQSDEDARKSVCEVARRLTGAVAASLFEPEDSSALRCSASTRPALVGFAIDLGRPSAMAAAFAGSSPVHVTVAEAGSGLDPEKLAEVERLAGQPVGGAAYVPMRAGDDYRGLLVVTYPPSATAANEDDLAALTVLAAQAGIAVEREDLLRKLEVEASTDALTRLGNRRLWDRVLGRAVERSRRLGMPLAAAMIDLDRFKQYNDRHGHLAGDALLRSTASAWSAGLRVDDVLCRIGGEEFGLLLPDCSADAARRAVGKLRAATPGGVTCSAGVAMLDRRERASDLMARADALLYEAKRSGRDRTAMTGARPAPTGAQPSAAPAPRPTGQPTPVPPSPQ